MSLILFTIILVLVVYRLFSVKKCIKRIEKLEERVNKLEKHVRKLNIDLIGR